MPLKLIDIGVFAANRLILSAIAGYLQLTGNSASNRGGLRDRGLPKVPNSVMRQRIQGLTKSVARLWQKMSRLLYSKTIQRSRKDRFYKFRLDFQFSTASV